MNDSKISGVFIDRDGVIIELPEYKEEDEVEFITKKEQIKFIDGSIEAIKKLNENNIPVIIISNQPQIARGISTKEDIEKIHDELNLRLKNNNAHIDDFYYCPHHPKKGINEYKVICECRKPKPGLIINASRKHNIKLESSYMIGDRTSDIKAGNLAGCKTIGVKTGYGCNDKFKDAIPDIKVKNLFEAVKIITKK